MHTETTKMERENQMQWEWGVGGGAYTAQA